jgi:hypothetical protein
LCDDVGQGYTHKCVYNSGKYCYGYEEKPSCSKRELNPKWVFYNSPEVDE